VLRGTALNARARLEPKLPQSSSRPIDRRRRPRLPLRGFAWAGLAATLIFTLGYWRYSDIDLDRQVDRHFRQLAQRKVDALVERMQAHERVLLGASGLFAASEAVSRDEWRAYIANLDLGTTLPGAHGTGFVVVVTRAEREAHERAVRAEGFPQYTIRPGGDREVYTSIVYLEPFEGRNLRAFGYDMYSEPTRRAAMDRARDSGAPAMTRKVTLVQETDEDVQAGFLIYVPVYARGKPRRSTTERRAALIGWVYSPYRAADLMDSVLSHFDRNAEVEVFDGEPWPGNLLYATPEATRTARHMTSFPIEIGGLQWTARFRSTEAFDTGISRVQTRLVLLAGLLLSMLVFMLLYAETRHRAALEEQVRERTLELEQARDEAEGASRAKSAFLATVSHELRTPLNAIIGFSSILLQEDLRAEQRKQLAIINRSGLQLLDLIKEILDITSIEAGHLAMHCEPLSLHHVVEEQCEALQVQARDGGLYLRLAEDSPHVMVVADKGRLSQVVRNLISNAIKFTDRGGVTVHCTTKDEFARVAVVDTGIGIPPEHHATLFVPFQRGDRHGSRPGTGLGLAISRRLVEAMGGEIGFESAVGQGSRFWFTVPRARSTTRST
jgi:signal transduction histidine kinase